MADLLRTDYKDDILDADKNTSRKYNMITNEDGAVSFVDVTDYSQVGDNFGGADINKTNEAVNELNNALGEIGTHYESVVYSPNAYTSVKTNGTVIANLSLPKGKYLIFKQGLISSTNAHPFYENGDGCCYYSKDNADISLGNGGSPLFLDSNEEFTISLKHGSSASYYYSNVTLHAVKIG